MMWMDDLKLAIIKEDVKKIDELIVLMPNFNDLKEMEKAFYLFQQAQDVLADKKETTLKEMKKLQSNIKFLRSTTDKKSLKSRLDLDV